MEYGKLGTAGVKVSRLALGTMTFGNEADKTESGKIYATARDAGINVFDCADVYAGGESERILGDLVREHRHEVLVTSKSFFPTGEGPNDRGTSRQRLVRSIDGSLKRLGTDYIDIYYLHRFDPDTPLEESLFTLDQFVRQGKILYVGLSNHAAWQIMKASTIADRRGYAPITVLQPMYNLLKRQCEVEILPMARSEGFAVMPFSPLGGGLLTGKYRSGGSGRFDVNAMYQKRYGDELNEKIVENYVGLARELGHDPVALAIAWVMSHPAVTAPLIGARSVAQLSGALGALDIDMTDELRERVSSLSPTPPPPTDRSEED